MRKMKLLFIFFLKLSGVAHLGRPKFEAAKKGGGAGLHNNAQCTMQCSDECFLSSQTKRPITKGPITKQPITKRPNH